jgi:hypothetical protein
MELAAAGSGDKSVAELAFCEALREEEGAGGFWPPC